MSKFRAILWDVDGTLFSFKLAEKHAIRDCFAEFGLGTCDDEMLAEYSQINDRYWKRLERGEITKPQVLVGRFEEFFGKYGLDVSVAALFNERYQVAIGENVFFNEGGYEIIRDLKGRVYQAVVTNGTKIAQDLKLKKSGLDQLFDDFFISDEIGCEKPGMGFFEVVFARMERFFPEGIDKSEILIVGDSLTSDMRGGNNAGIRCCWFNPEHKRNETDVRIDYEIRRLDEVRTLL